MLISHRPKLRAATASTRVAQKLLTIFGREITKKMSIASGRHEYIVVWKFTSPLQYPYLDPFYLACCQPNIIEFFPMALP